MAKRKAKVEAVRAAAEHVADEMFTNWHDRPLITRLVIEESDKPLKGYAGFCREAIVCRIEQGMRKLLRAVKSKATRSKRK
jgi:hypothetical protein